MSANPYIPFPTGTVRGPFLSDSEKGRNTKVQYCVRQQDGSWVYFIQPANEEKKARQAASDFSSEVLAQATV